MDHPLDRDRPSTSQVWLDVVSAVDYLSRGRRPGLTVYHALEEALRWHATWSIDGDDDDQAFPTIPEPLWEDPDSLHTTLGHLVVDHPPASAELTLADVIHHALNVWATGMSEQHNSAQPWAHPISR